MQKQKQVSYPHQIKYKTKKMAYDPVEFKGHRAALQREYRMRKKENQTPRQTRLERRKERDRKRRQREAKKHITSSTHTIGIETTPQLNYVESQPLQESRIEPIVPESTTKNQISLSAHKRERAKLARQLGSLRQENLRLQRLVWKWEKRNVRVSRKVSLLMVYIIPKFIEIYGHLMPAGSDKVQFATNY
jgi:hypothetical protein